MHIGGLGWVSSGLKNLNPQFTQPMKKAYHPYNPTQPTHALNLWVAAQVGADQGELAVCQVFGKSLPVIMKMEEGDSLKKENNTSDKKQKHETD